MVKFTVEQLRSLMELKHNIRNVSVIAHVNHGETTLTESLIQSSSGIEAGHRQAEPKNSVDLPKLVEGMKRLAKSDPMVLCYTEESGEHIIAASGELHLKMCLQDLQNDFIMGTEVKVSDPVVSLRETCTAESSQICLARSANKHSHLFVCAEPIGPELCQAIDDGDVRAGTESQVLGRQLADNFGWEVSEARKIWAFGPGRLDLNSLSVTLQLRIQWRHEVFSATVGVDVVCFVLDLFRRLGVAGGFCVGRLCGLERG